MRVSEAEDSRGFSHRAILRSDQRNPRVAEVEEPFLLGRKYSYFDARRNCQGSGDGGAPSVLHEQIPQSVEETFGLFACGCPVGTRGQEVVGRPIYGLNQEG